MNTCETCKHWDTSNEWESGHSLGLGRCQRVVMFWDATEWDDEGDGRRFIAEYADRKAFTQDASDYSAKLLTKPDFCCVSHEAR